MKVTEKARLIIGWALVAYIILHIVLNLKPVVVFFLFAKIEMPVAFLIIASAAMGAGAIYAFRFIRVKKKKEEKKD